ncbi:MAG: hypothetical protein ACOZD0_07745 [Pseudomonadota bacterium]
MKRLLAPAALAAALCAPLSSLLPAAALAHENTLTPRHGGVVVEVRDVEYELVAQPQRLALHLRDHGRALIAPEARARVTLLAGGKTQQVELQPSGDHLQADGAFAVGPGAKAVAVVTVPGRQPATARFVLR